MKCWLTSCNLSHCTSKTNTSSSSLMHTYPLFVSSRQLIRIKTFCTSSTKGNSDSTFPVFQRERPSQQQSSGFTRFSFRNAMRMRHSESAFTRSCRNLQTGQYQSLEEFCLFFASDLLVLVPQKCNWCHSNEVPYSSHVMLQKHHLNYWG